MSLGVGCADHRGFEHRYYSKTLKIDFDEKFCIYRKCRHRMKEHDGKTCKCNHRQTNIDGIGFTPSIVILEK